MTEKKEDSGFVIQDKRSSHQSEDENKAREAEVEKERKKEQERQEAAGQDAGKFEINFSTFVLSLTSSAFYYLGDLPDPATGQIQENLPAVKQTIDILMMLQEKTKNNLDPEEAKLLEQLIYELQMKYIAKKPKS